MKTFKKLLHKILQFLKKNPFKILFVIFFLALSTYVVTGTLSDDTTKVQEQEFDPDAKGDERIAVDVDVVLVKKEDVRSSKNLPGRVTAFRQADIRPQVGGVIREVKFLEGSFVNEGDQLYVIDDSIYEADLKSAVANLKFLQKKKYRFKKLLKVGAISKLEYDAVVSDYVTAKQDVKKAQINIEYTKVLAPISGHISAAKYKKGSLVSANQDEILAVINQIDPILVDVRYPAKDFDILRNNLDAKIVIETNNGYVIEGGKIDSFEKEIDELSDSFLVRISVANKSLKLVPKMYVDVKFFYDIKKGLTIPIRSAYRNVDGSLFVWYVDLENIVSKKTIKVSGIFEDKYIVSEGLSENDEIILAGVQKIYEGALVNPNIAGGLK